MPLIDEQNKRILFEDGVSLVSDDTYVRMILSGEEIPSSVKVLRSRDSEIFELFYKKSVDIEEGYSVDLLPNDHDHTEADVDRLLSLIEASDRYTGSEEQQARVAAELRFFVDTKNVTFLLGVCDLIARFRREGVVWGVGRGSSCSSLILYIVGQHDVDPLKYGIRFSELTKDMDYDE